MGSYHQPANYLKGWMKLSLNTTYKKQKSKLSKSKLNSIQKKLDDFDYDAENDEQYKTIKSILDSLDNTDFNSDYHQKELGILKHTITKVGKKGVSKPSEFVNVLKRILDDVESKNGGGGSYHQPANYLKGGFYPSVMGGVMSAGKLLMIASLRQGYKMFSNKTSNKNASSKSLRKTRKMKKKSNA